MTAVADRAAYYGRVFSAYLGGSRSHLSFWHETPEMNEAAFTGKLGAYFQRFAEKAAYVGPFDGRGVPLLNYHGRIGRQYNPISIAQYGLARYNRWLETSEQRDFDAFLRQADWLVVNLKPNRFGYMVWMHWFDWEYREGLRAPWYSGLAQGQGLSLLLRAFKETGEEKYRRAAGAAFQSMLARTSDGGVLFHDARKRTWIEEYLVTPPSHILNGFIWALWGVYEYGEAMDDAAARELFAAGVKTLESALPEYDTGYWSTYDLSKTVIPMVASPFYHKLHIMQLRVMARLTGKPVFGEFADKWQAYQDNKAYRTAALVQKGAFKLLYY